MNWLWQKVAGSGGIESEGESKSVTSNELVSQSPKEEEVENDPCGCCGNPCHNHKIAPSSLRIDMTRPLAGSIGSYKRHVFLCTGTPSWPSKIKKQMPYAKTLLDGIDQKALPYEARVTAIDYPSPGNENDKEENYDLLVFPECIRYIRVKQSQLPIFIEDQLVKEIVSPNLEHKPITGTHIFVCNHKIRDKRCGVIGNLVIEEFQRCIEQKHLTDVHVYGASHTGGHKFAGNCLFFPSGDWYGRVTTCDVHKLLDAHLVHNKTIERLWRGKMGEATPPPTKDW